MMAEVVIHLAVCLKDFFFFFGGGSCTLTVKPKMGRSLPASPTCCLFFFCSVGGFMCVTARFEKFTCNFDITG